MLLLIIAACLVGTHGFQYSKQCKLVTGDELEYHCAVADTQVFFNGRVNEYVIIECHGTNFTCEDLPTNNFGNGMPLLSLGVKRCSPAMLPCLNKALNTSSIAYVTLINPTKPLGEENVLGLGDVRNLVIKNGADRTIPMKAFGALKDLESLRITETQLTLQSNEFTNTTALTYLELSTGNILEVPEDAFKGLSSLETLNVWGNNFSEVGVNSLRGLDSLQMLSLNDNGISKMAVGSLNQAPLLKSISLIRDRLEELPPGVFHNLTKLQNITIQRNIGPLKLYNHSFSKLPSLKNLIIEDCGINLPEQLVTGCDVIQRLSLSYNRIQDIPVSFFKDMRSLQSLDMSFNRIVKLESGVFHPLKNLEYLNLNRNHLEVLPDFLFSGLKKLNYISIDHNYLTFISPLAFQGAIGLKTISLISNKLTLKSNDNFEGDYMNFEEYSPFNSLVELKNLYLNDNKISTMFADWRMVLIKLEKLNLSLNNFSFLDETDCQFLSQNIVVDLQHNNITSLVLEYATISPTDSKSPHDSQSPNDSSPKSSILLDNNPLICDCGLYNLAMRLRGFKSFTTEPKFVVGNSKCASPPKLNGDLFKNVSPYDLNCNLPPENCSENCSTCEMRPGTTDLFYNCMSKPRILPNPEKFGVKFMSLKLATPPITINDLNLQLLNLSKIGLKEINFAPSKSVKAIDFSNNNLTKIPIEFLKTNITLYLSNNPFECQCSNSEEIALLKQSDFVKDLDFVTCENGDELILKDVHSLCSSKRAAVIATATFIALVIAMAIIIAIIFRYSRPILVFIIEKGLFPSCFIDDPDDKNKEYDVFISYAHKDRQYISKLLPKLENEFGLKTCVHYRDWSVGDFIPDQINRSVEKSRRTLILLSDNFLDSDYANMEFRAAHNLALKEGKTRVILILLHDITKNEKLSEEIKLHMRMNTYLKWEDFRFSEKLQRALPLKHNKIFVLSNVFKQVQEKSVKPGLDVHLNSNGQLVNMAVKDIV